MMTGAGIVPFILLCNMHSNKNYFRKLEFPQSTLKKVDDFN